MAKELAFPSNSGGAGPAVAAASPAGVDSDDNSRKRKRVGRKPDVLPLECGQKVKLQNAQTMSWLVVAQMLYNNAGDWVEVVRCLGVELDFSPVDHPSLAMSLEKAYDEYRAGVAAMDA